MSLPKFPTGWDANRVKRLIDHYEELSEDEMTAEDEAAAENQLDQAVATVPNEIRPTIR